MPFRITCVCLGNICRSPIAAAVLRDRFDAAGVGGRVVVDSAGTGPWHVGDRMDRRASAVLAASGYDHDHRGRQLDHESLAGIDLLLAMDAANYADLDRMRAGARPLLRMLRSYDPALAGVAEPDPRLDVPDPYYGGPADFEQVLAMCEKAADGLVDGLPGLLRG